MRKPSMKQAVWIASNMTDSFGEANPDDIYDVLLGNIDTPQDFVSQVEYWANQYEEDLRRGNERKN